jgi:hypothetical protein
MCASAAVASYAAFCVILRPLICNSLMLLKEGIFLQYSIVLEFGTNARILWLGFSYKHQLAL